MAGEEVEMIDDNFNYEVLAQIYTIINDKISQKSIAMEKVLQKNFDINYSVPQSKCSLPNIVGRTALDSALNKGELEIFQMLIKRGADFTDQNKNDTTILHRVIEKSHVKSQQCHELKGKLEHPFVESVLSAHVESNTATNPHDQNGISHFHIACMFNHTQAVEYFLAKGVSVNQAIKQNSKILPGYTPLHLAARYSAFETAKLLLDRNANFELKDFLGAAPLHLLIQRNIETLDWLNVQKQKLCDKLKEELLINEKIIKLILEKTRNIEEDLSRCHIACTLQDTHILEKTMGEGANLNDSVSETSPFWSGYTALHFAAIFNVNAVKLLLANGADLFAKDSNGVTPFDLCLQRYSPEVIHSIMSTITGLNEVTFSNTRTKLCDLVLAMSDEDSLRTFLREGVKNVNVTVPFDSPVWQGYSILHIAIALSDRIYDNKDPNKDTDYKEDVKQDWNDYEEADYFKRIKLCLSMGADVTITDIHNSTPVHLAFRIQNIYIVELLLENHQNIVDVVDGDNFSHLHIACAVGQIDVVEKLLQTGADVNRPIMSTFDFQRSEDEDDMPQVLHVNPGFTCLHMAMASWNVAMETLIEHGADLYARDSFEMTPIHQMLRSDCCNDDEISVSLPKHSKNCPTNYGLTHLHVACFLGDFKVAKELLENGADIEAKINYNQVRSVRAMAFLAAFDGYTPLHCALRGNRAQIVILLVKRGADLFAKSTDGIIPLYEALKIPFKNADDDSELYFSTDEEFSDYDSDYDHDTNKSTFALDLLSYKKIERLVKEHSGITELHIACLVINRKKVSKLLKNGADPNAQINVDSPIWPGYTPLHVLMTPRFAIDDKHKYQYQIYSNIEAIGKMLLKRGARVTLKDAEGNTPIHMAPELMWSDSKIEDDGLYTVGWILKGLSDFTVNPIDARGISHFEVACMTAQRKVIEEFLKQSCVDVNRRFGHFTDRYGGFTPVHLASFYKCDSVVDLLLKYKADPHARDFLGNTPLHSTAVYCRLSPRSYNDTIYEILLEAGAEAEAKNLWNEPPLAVALRTNLFTNNALYIMIEDNHTRRINLFNLENEEGLLGRALRYRCKRRSLEEECFYKAIVNAPNLNDIDEMGRTVIHNAVSINKPPNDHWKNGSIEDYANIIHGFIKLDFDIDCQDNKGQTALHKAARFGNYNAIIGLLMNGADINIVDINNKPAFAYIIERNEDAEDIRRNILQACFLHVYKLQIAGLEISDVNQEIVAQIRKKSISCPNEMQSCIKELESLKKHTINSSYSVTMYNFLSETTTYFRMMLFLRDTIDAIFTKNATSLHRKYPYFAGLLQMQYRNIFIRSQLLEPAKTALGILADFEVPDLCCDKILKFLKNKDLKQIISATDLQ